MMAQTGSNLALDNMNYFYSLSTQQLRLEPINDQQVQQQGKPDEIMINIQNFQAQIIQFNLQLFEEKLNEVKNRIQYFVHIDFDPIASWRNEYQKCQNYFDRINSVKEKCKNITELITGDLELILSCIYNQTEQQYIKDLEKLLQIVKIHEPEKLKLVGEFKPWMSGVGMIQFPQGYRIIGEINFGYLSGRGVFITSKNLIFKGTFNKNKLEGLGTVIRPDGMKIDGLFHNSLLLPGNIKFTHIDGKIIEATLKRENEQRKFSFADFNYSLNDANQTVFQVKKLVDNEQPKVYCLKRNNQILSKVDEDGNCQGLVVNQQRDNLLFTQKFDNVGMPIGRTIIRNIYGQLLKSGEISNNQLTGQGKKYYEISQKIFESGMFNQDELEGEGIRYYDDQNGQIKERGVFLKGLLHGKGKKFYQNGQIMEEGEFQDNLLEGEGAKYHQNGKMMEKGFFLKGLLQGEGEKRYENGACQEYGIFENGQLHSLQFESAKAYPNGQIQEIGYFQNGKLQGQGKTFYLDEKIKEEGNFIQGELISGIKYYENGNKKEEGEFEGNLLNGPGGKQYYINGEIKSEGNYENGELQNHGSKFFQCYQITGLFNRGNVSGSATLTNHSLTMQNYYRGAHQSIEELLQAAGNRIFPLQTNPFK